MDGLYRWFDTWRKHEENSAVNLTALNFLKQQGNFTLVTSGCGHTILYPVIEVRWLSVPTFCIQCPKVQKSSVLDSVLALRRSNNYRLKMTLFHFIITTLFLQIIQGKKKLSITKNRNWNHLGFSGVQQPQKFHNHEELTAELKAINEKYPDLTQLYSLDKKSVLGRELWVMRISTEGGGQRADLKPMVKYVANMHGNEVTGRELMLTLIKHLLEGYKDKSVNIEHNHFFWSIPKVPKGSFPYSICSPLLFFHQWHTKLNWSLYLLMYKVPFLWWIQSSMNCWLCCQAYNSALFILFYARFGAQFHVYFWLSPTFSF